MATLLLLTLTGCFGLDPLVLPAQSLLEKPLLWQSPVGGLANRPSAVATKAPSPQRTVVAIAGLLGGNTLVPLAQYVAGQWVRTWPLPDTEVTRTFRGVEELPRSWYPVPGGLPTDWILWAENQRGIPLHVGAPILGQAHCQAVWGLSTRLQSFDHETTAIATNGQSDNHPFTHSTLEGAVDPRLRPFLRAEVEKAESAAIRTSRKGANDELARRRDSEFVYQLSCVRTGKEDRKLCSFEASRRLGGRSSEGNAGCDDIVIVQGWFATSLDGFTLVQAHGTATDCDSKELRTTTPLLLIVADARTFVVVREHGYEDESFAVFELRGNRLQPALEVPGGGC
jgi:hypothetical protein